LIGEASRAGSDTWRLTLDGPLSMFSATQKYGLQLALFLPAVLNEERFTLTAELRWGPEKKPKRFVLDDSVGLTSRYVETGVYVPPEVEMFASQFRKKIAEWELADAVEVIPLGEHFWVPDFRLVERSTGREVLLEILGFWRKGGAEAHVDRLQKHSKRAFVLALATSLQIDEETLPESARVVRFKSMPGPDTVAAAATQALAEHETSAASRRRRPG
jgi:predicted nuclease of restriction endonuclease-like RecB superfamily